MIYLYIHTYYKLSEFEKPNHRMVWNFWIILFNWRKCRECTDFLFVCFVVKRSEEKAQWIISHNEFSHIVFTISNININMMHWYSILFYIHATSSSTHTHSHHIPMEMIHTFGRFILIYSNFCVDKTGNSVQYRNRTILAVRITILVSCLHCKCVLHGGMFGHLRQMWAKV